MAPARPSRFAAMPFQSAHRLRMLADTELTCYAPISVGAYGRRSRFSLSASAHQPAGACSSPSQKRDNARNAAAPLRRPRANRTQNKPPPALRSLAGGGARRPAGRRGRGGRKRGTGVLMREGWRAEAVGCGRHRDDRPRHMRAKFSDARG